MTKYFEFAWKIPVPEGIRKVAVCDRWTEVKGTKTLKEGDITLDLTDTISGEGVPGLRAGLQVLGRRERLLHRMEERPEGGGRARAVPGQRHPAGRAAKRQFFF